jgi:sugar phosphate isomerase/epimerase
MMLVASALVADDAGFDAREIGAGDPQPIALPVCGLLSAADEDDVRAAIARAVELGADAVIVPLVPVGSSRSAERLHQAAAMLGRLLPQAEDAGVTLAVRNVAAAVPGDPAGMRDFLDRLNSWAAAACVDPGGVAPAAAVDWVLTLGPRINRIRVRSPAGFDWPAVAAALAEVGFRGPVVVDGGDPAEWRRLLGSALPP